MDYHYIYETQHGGVNQLISSQKNLKNFHLNLEDYKDNLLIRDWGPGIMYEFVLPFALLLGSKKIITYGWDIADKNNQNTHFDEINLKKFFEKKFEKFIFDANNDFFNYDIIPISDFHYININEYDKIYSNDTVQDENFTSLDVAFLLHPEFFLKNKKKYNKEELESNFNDFKI